MTSNHMKKFSRPLPLRKCKSKPQASKKKKKTQALLHTHRDVCNQKDR